MNAKLIRIGGALASLVLASALSAAQPTLTRGSSTDTAAPAESDTITEALKGGKITLDARARYENVDVPGLEDADALTLRTRFGFTTAPVYGVTASIEAENISALDGDKYNQAGLNPGGAGRAIVADPEITEINQAWVGYESDLASAKIGRQRLVFDNARFIGDVGWRQNMQTFDALVAKTHAVDHFDITYAYLDRINRVFGADHPQGRWDSDSHLLNVAYDGLADVTLTGYAYLLEFDTVAASSSATYGVSATGKRTFNDIVFDYRAEYARQTDYRNNPTDYGANYYAVDLGASLNQFSLGGGYEVLSDDNGVGFATPLATGHAFNGWADSFLTTPSTGLRDLYGRVGVKLPYNVALLAGYHKFDDDSGVDLGNEWDLSAAWKINDRFKTLLKFASFESETVALTNTHKLWAQVDFTF